MADITVSIMEAALSLLQLVKAWLQTQVDVLKQRSVGCNHQKSTRGSYPWKKKSTVMF